MATPRKTTKTAPAEIKAGPKLDDEQIVFTHTISAVPEKGFCRAGVRWHREPTYVNRADWDDDEWQALTNEPNLVVRELAL